MALNGKTYRDFGFNGFFQKRIPAAESRLSTLQVRNSLPYASVGSSAVSIPLNASTDITFSSTDNDTAAWTTGTVYFANGTNSGTVDAGNTGNISGDTFIYWDRDTPNILQTSTTPEGASGANRLLVAIVEQGASGKDCKITPTIAAGLHVSDLIADQITANTITGNEIKIGMQSFTSTIAWTATDEDTADWGAGDIKFVNGTTYSISSGDTGNIAATTFVYLDIDASTTVLQTTTTAATAVGDNKTLVAIVIAGASGAKCVIDVVRNTGTTIDGDKIVTGKIQSADGNTYFDLDNNQIIINDGSDDRILIGFQSGGF